MISIIPLLLLVTLVASQPPIPNTYPGHPIGNPGAPILLEAFFDQLCPDSLAAWPVVQQVVQKNSFFVTQAGLVIEATNGNKTWWEWLDLIFDKQDDYSTEVTQNVTGNDIISQLQMDALTLGVDSNDFMNGMEYGNGYDEEARINWKYATTRGIYGTPLFLVNGVSVTADETWTVYQWSQLIDSLLPSRRQTNVKESSLKMLKNIL